VRYAAEVVVFLLSDEKRLQSERGEGKSWISKIPDIHAPKALYTPLSSTSLASDCKPGAAEELERDSPKHKRFQEKPLAEEHPLVLPHTFDRLSSPMRAKEAPTDTPENSSAAEFCSPESSETSSYSKGLLSDAKIFPRVLLGSSSQSTAEIPDAYLLAQMSLALPSPSAVPVITGTSYSSATDAASGNDKLGDYFHPMKYSRTKFTDVQCQDIARLLRESRKESWSLVPRLYIILRIIGQLRILDAFINQGINDFWLPLIASSLPHALSVAYHQEFITTQDLVLTKGLSLENNTKGHAHFTRDDLFPFEIKETLGRGGFGVVDRISSHFSGQEYARKRFRRGKNFCKRELHSFMNELTILKRLHHIHCIDLVSISSIQRSW
jgi:hypothetical protein